MLTGAGTGTPTEGTEIGGTETEGADTEGTDTEGTETGGTETAGRGAPTAELGRGTGSPEATDETVMADAVDAAATTAPMLSATTLAVSVVLDATRS